MALSAERSNISPWRRTASAMIPAAVLWLMGCDSQLDRPASFGYVHSAILAPGCATASCHSSSQAIEDIDLGDQAAAYLSLTGVRCGEEDPSLYVNPGDPERSAILSIMRSTGGDRMPPDIALPDEELALVERWIAEGALCN